MKINTMEYSSSFDLHSYLQKWNTIPPKNRRSNNKRNETKPDANLKKKVFTTLKWMLPIDQITSQVSRDSRIFFWPITLYAVVIFPGSLWCCWDKHKVSLWFYLATLVTSKVAKQPKWAMVREIGEKKEDLSPLPLGILQETIVLSVTSVVD